MFNSLLQMKFIINPFIRAILILAAWFFCIRKIYIDFDHSYFIDLVQPALIVLASIVSLISFLVDYVQYKAGKKLDWFIPTFISVLCIVALFVVTDRLKQQDRTPTILHASTFYDGLSRVAIDFRENGTYKCKKSSLLGDGYCTRGHYTIKDSIIFLDKSNLHDLLKTDKLLMKTIAEKAQAKKRNLLTLLFGSSKPDTLPGTYLFQVNHRGDMIPSAIVLSVKDNTVGHHD